MIICWNSWSIVPDAVEIVGKCGGGAAGGLAAVTGGACCGGVGVGAADTCIWPCMCCCRELCAARCWW